ncbi:hypothetical protein N7468_001394 [Penicillium chermesinum]|uniref:Uncharacterized protein n=1 Tax=Penicillium chermesinum TaxID=63820 RepID=A0A9W9TWI6_9EURO|nr:uncharacterized protein N7468_001394 [Penicillium chermesinum]KAJ5246411.1 hypothetical protein N7468_001394 [Penicillium chermesinum]
MFLATSVWLSTEERTKTSLQLISIPGDATYGMDVLDKEEPDGMNDDPQRALQTLRKIEKFARDREVIVLPSHGRNTPRLLDEKPIYRPSYAS